MNVLYKSINTSLSKKKSIYALHIYTLSLSVYEHDVDTLHKIQLNRVIELC